jgi:hypothetical protein
MKFWGLLRGYKNAGSLRGVWPLPLFFLLLFGDILKTKIEIDQKKNSTALINRKEPNAIDAPPLQPSFSIPTVGCWKG